MLKYDQSRFAEVVFDISASAQYLIDTGEIVVEDSRELFSSILLWAIHFEALFPGDWDEEEYAGDYINAIDIYSREKLLEAYAA